MATSREQLKDIFEFCRDLCRSETYADEEILDEFNKQLWIWRYNKDHERFRRLIENGLSAKNA